jgi:hypothetical protein
MVSSGDALICDFEESADRDYDGWPDHWTRRRSRELPEFLKVGIVPELGASAAQAGSKKSANRCLQIELDGGGAVLSSPPCPISAQFSLALTVRLKTTGLVHDGAWVELALLDAEGNVLQTHSTTPSLLAPTGKRSISARLPPSIAKSPTRSFRSTSSHSTAAKTSRAALGSTTSASCDCRACS